MSEDTSSEEVARIGVEVAEPGSTTAGVPGPEPTPGAAGAVRLSLRRRCAWPDMPRPTKHGDPGGTCQRGVCPKSQRSPASPSPSDPMLQPQRGRPLPTGVGEGAVPEFGVARLSSGSRNRRRISRSSQPQPAQDQPQFAVPPQPEQPQFGQPQPAQDQSQFGQPGATAAGSVAAQFLRNLRATAARAVAVRTAVRAATSAPDSQPLAGGHSGPAPKVRVATSERLRVRVTGIPVRAPRRPLSGPPESSAPARRLPGAPAGYGQPAAYAVPGQAPAGLTGYSPVGPGAAAFGLGAAAGAATGFGDQGQPPVGQADQPGFGQPPGAYGSRPRVSATSPGSGSRRGLRLPGPLRSGPVRAGPLRARSYGQKPQTEDIDVDGEEPKRSRLPLIILLAVLGVVVLAGLIWYFFLRDSGGTEVNPTQSPNPTATGSVAGGTSAACESLAATLTDQDQTTEISVKLQELGEERQRQPERSVISATRRRPSNLRRRSSPSSASRMSTQGRPPRRTRRTCSPSTGGVERCHHR